MICILSLPCSAPVGTQKSIWRAVHLQVQPSAPTFMDLWFFSLLLSCSPFLLTPSLNLHFFFLTLHKWYNNQAAMNLHWARPPHHADVKTPVQKNKQQSEPGRECFLSQLLIYLLILVCSLSSSQKTRCFLSPSHLPSWTVSDEIRRLKEDGEMVARWYQYISSTM